MVIKNRSEFLALRESGRRLAEVCALLAESVRVGMQTIELDIIAREEIAKRGGKPSFLGYGRPPFPGAVCVSLNQAVVHGIPSERTLELGDIVGIDIGMIFDGMYTDMATTVSIGDISPENQRLIAATRESLSVGIAAGKVGERVGAIGSAVESVWKKYGYETPRELSGHGVGAGVHESPTVPNIGPASAGPKIRDGEVLAIEPMLVAGKPGIRTASDKWTIVTADGKPSAHFEHTVVYSSHWKTPIIVTVPGAQSTDDGLWLPA